MAGITLDQIIQLSRAGYMAIPLILTAFGTASIARKTYDSIEAAVRTRFPSNPLYWGYTSAVLRDKLYRQQQVKVEAPQKILEHLAASGCKRAVVQSLHLFPGSEFHKLKKDISRVASLTCSLGGPLLSSPEDYDAVTSILAPLIEPQADQAVLIVGHGTSHPVWPVYLALEHLLQARFGPRVFIGTIDHYPETDRLEEVIAAKGYTSVLMIPFFLTAGRHFSLDMMGNEEKSWRSRLQKQGLKTAAVEDGLGLLPGFDQLLAGHIFNALSFFDT